MGPAGWAQRDELDRHTQPYSSALKVSLMLPGLQITTDTVVKNSPAQETGVPDKHQTRAIQAGSGWKQPLAAHIPHTPTHRLASQAGPSSARSPLVLTAAL